jgi:hypothetical protein
MKKRAKPKACKAWAVYGHSGGIYKSPFERLYAYDTKEAAEFAAGGQTIDDSSIVRVVITPIPKKRRKK